MNQAKLADIDIRNTQCPKNVLIKIEGYDGFSTDISPSVSLLVAIAHTYHIRTGVLVEPVELLERITVLEFDEVKKFMKVRIADEP